MDHGQSRAGHSGISKRAIVTLVAIALLVPVQFRIAAGGEAGQPDSCGAVIHQIYEALVRPQSPDVNYKQFIDAMKFAGFDLKLTGEQLVARVQEVYNDPTRMQLFRGVQVKLARPNGEAIPAKLGAVWMNEYEILSMGRGGHPLFTFHEKMDAFTQYVYGKAYKDLPPEILQRVSREDHEIYPLASGWVVVTSETPGNPVIATTRLHFAEFERGLGRGLPVKPDIWMLPMEKSGHGTDGFITPEHQMLLNEGQKLLAEMQERFRAAKNEAEYDVTYEMFRLRWLGLHKKYQVAEIGRLAKDPELQSPSVMPQIMYGVLQLMRQKSIQKTYYYALKPALVEYYQKLFYRPWGENGVLAEIKGSGSVPNRWVMSFTQEQILKYLKKTAVNPESGFSSIQLQFLQNH